LVDECERKQKLLLVSTNLSKQELTDRYQLRTFDRLTAITRRVFFIEGESFRH
jgi:DNA replication protein DnaC